MIKNLSFQKKLIISYSLIVTIVIVSIVSVFYVYYQESTYKSLEGTFEREAKSISDQIDSTLYMADRLSLQLKYNPELMSSFYKIALSGEGKDYFKNHETVAYKLQDIVISIIGIDPQFFNRVAIISKTGAFLNIGAYCDKNKTEEILNNITWFKQLEDVNTYKLLLPPHRDSWDDQGVTVISIIRKMQDSGYIHSLIEIQIPLEYLENNILASDKDIKDKEVIIMDENRNIIYPYTQSISSNNQSISKNTKLISKNTDSINKKIALEHEEYEQIKKSTRQKDSGVFSINDFGKDKLVSFQRASYTGWTVFIMRNKAQVLAPLKLLLYFVIGMGAIISILSIIVIYILTRKWLDPLRRLSNSMNKINIDYLQSDVNLGDSHNELVYLNDSFKQMLIRLDESRERVIKANSRELQARLIALQSQVNPHFLCNTLSMIGMMGQDNGSTDIMNVCASLSDMFRYIIHANQENVTIEDEIKHTSDYLEIMKMRYGRHLNYSIEIDENMYDIELPKLILQPIVENSIKHGFANKRPPWKIRIHGKKEENYWSVIIHDNGEGFKEEILKTFEHKKEIIRNELENGSITNSESKNSGFGIVNTYSRLYLQFKSNAIFNVYNDSVVGGTVEIGAFFERVGFQDDSNNVS